MSNETPNSLLEALPPATDYLTYLTIIEYNLTPENLPTLHEVLQDVTLTTNIGWDLIHLLVPLLPGSDKCLQDIARLGNPREVIIKVTESLRLIDFDTAEEQEENDDEAKNEALARQSLRTAPVPHTDQSSPTQAIETPPEPSLQVLQFIALLSMLSVLHPRIKTKYPSRFLSTTLQAILATYSGAGTYIEEITPAVIQFIKAISGTKRPHLPPRRNTNQNNILLGESAAPDPEGSAEPPDDDELAMQRRLLQSFLTHFVEEYMLSLASAEDIPGLALCTRLQERLHPEWTVPNRLTLSEQFSKDPKLLLRTTIIGQIVALTQDLGLELQDLYSTLTDKMPESTGYRDEEDDPPSSAADIPLSRRGAAFLLAARQSAPVLYNESTTAPAISIFPTHIEILQSILVAADASEFSTVGSETPALLDCLLALALLALENNQIGEPVDDEDFHQYLQKTSLISANCPSPNIRYHAHYLTSTILRSHPSDQVRLAFIRDTLEHCPFENLKASAVSWLKGELLEANSPLPNPTVDGAAPSPALSRVGEEAAVAAEQEEAPPLFATPIALATLSTYLFPDLVHDLTGQSLGEAWMAFKPNVPFYLATLNLYRLLLGHRHLRETLDVGALHVHNDIGGSYLWPLKQACEMFKKDLESGGEIAREEGESGTGVAIGEVSIVQMVLGEVEAGVLELNQTN
ncbi:DUF1760-domain-containing protein [Viridothelium virens]|uniref:DUF1760-domain-containing protein n=1 Tax=Viridothelium virens TaxID=1048519 RepID=A0A6A6HLL0_VIRVR|nr:DUF1760-domain-containing protein [Viridothelium virens]